MIKKYSSQRGIFSINHPLDYGVLFDLGIGAQILRDLDISRFRLLTDTAGKAVGLQGYGLSVTERVPLADRS